MKAIHSLWTDTRDFALTRDSAIVMSAAAAYTNRAFAKTELITDCKGLQIAERLGWEFTGYSTRLQEFCPPYAKHVWALGKIAAQSWQAEPFIHIDNDVLMFNPPPRRILNAQLAVQGFDEPEGYYGPERALLAEACGFTPGVAAYNTGIIAWRDPAICKSYCEMATDAAMVIAKVSGDGFACSLVAEQYALGEFVTRYENLHVERAVPMASVCTDLDFEDIQFLHAWAGTKKNPAWVARIDTRFKRDFPAAYARARYGYHVLKQKGIAI